MANKNIDQLEDILTLIDKANFNMKWFIMQTLERELGVKVQTGKDIECEFCIHNDCAECVY